MRRFLAACCALLLLSLTACGKPPAEASPSPSPRPTVAATARPSPTPKASAAPTPEPAPSTTPGEVTEETIRKDPEFRGDYGILKVIPDEDGFFVWYGPSGAKLDKDGRCAERSALAWVDKITGEKVYFPQPDNDSIALLETAGSRNASVRTTGISPANGWRGVPVTYHYFVDENNQCVVERDPWQPIGPELDLGLTRAAVVYDARVGVNDLALVFVPPATERGISEFITAATYIPRVTIRHDAAQNAMFLTIHGAALQSGELEEGCEDWVYDFIRDNGLAYPNQMTAGSLGRDNRFFTSAAISSNGTDTTITLLLTEHAYRYTAEVEYLAADMYPTLRLVFRDRTVDEQS